MGEVKPEVCDEFDIYYFFDVILLYRYNIILISIISAIFLLPHRLPTVMITMIASVDCKRFGVHGQANFQFTADFTPAPAKIVE